MTRPSPSLYRLRSEYVRQLHRYYEKTPTSLALSVLPLKQHLPLRSCMLRSARPCTSRRRPGPFIKRRPYRLLRNGSSETSQVPVKPTRHHALLSDPAESFTPGIAAQTLLPSTLKTVSASGSYSFRGSIARPSDPLCTLRSQGRPCTTQHSVPAGCQPLPGRFIHCRVPSEVFSHVRLHTTSHSYRLNLAHFQQNRPKAALRLLPGISLSN